MTWTPTDEQEEKAKQAIVDADLLDRYVDSDAEDIAWEAARAVLVAVGPMIAASALRHASADILTNPPIDRYGRVMTGARAAAKQVEASAYQIEKEAGR